MNKILRYFFIALMSVFALHMSAQKVVTFDASVDKGTCTTENPGEDEVSKEGVTIALSNGCMNLAEHYRCYAGADFTITSTESNILKVEITCTAKGQSKNGPGGFADPTAGTYEYEANGQGGTWIGNDASFSMSASKQVRITKVVVTLGDAPKAPVFSIPEGVYFEPQTVAMSAEEGTFIIYTLNGEDPDYTDDSNYTGIKYDGTPLTISETTTIAAIAVDAKGTTSNIVSATYTVVTIQGGVTFDASADKGTHTSSDPGEDQVAKEGVSVTVSNGCMNLTNQYRCYAGADFTVSSTGTKIVKVEITCTANGDEQYGPGCLSDPTTGTYTFETDGKTGTWIGNADSFSLSATRQVRITKVVVSLSDTPVEPSFSMEQGMYFGLQKVTMSSGTGNFIIYTVNGDTPAYTDDSNFTGIKYDGTELTITETTTIKAIAVNSKGKSSSVATATYSIVNTEGHGTVESPFTVADALVVLDALRDVGVNTYYYTKGYVIGDIMISGDDRATFRISDKADDPTGMMNVYLAKGLEEGVYTEGDMKAGDEVVICAMMMYFGTSPELYPGYIYSINGKTSKTTGIQTITAEKLKNTAVYNMQGIRVDNPQKGLYIINGKKVVVK